MPDNYPEETLLFLEFESATSIIQQELYSDKKMLIGEKVNLRRIETADLWQLWHWHEMEELYLFNRIDPYISYDEANQKFDDYFHRMMDFLIEKDHFRFKE